MMSTFIMPFSIPLSPRMVNTHLTDLRDAPWQVTDVSDDIDERCATWRSLFLSVFDQHAPLVKVRVKRRSCDWLSADIRSLMRSRNYHHHKYLKSRFQVSWENHKALRNEVNRQVRLAKVSQFTAISQEMRQQPKLAWSWLNAALRRSKTNLPLSHYISRSEASIDDSSIANRLIEHFCAPNNPSQPNHSDNLSLLPPP